MRNYYKECTKCGNDYTTTGIENMSGPTHSCINVYGQEYNLCPDCTRQLWSFVTNRDKTQTTKSINPKTIKFKAYKEMAKYLKKRKTFEMPKHGISDVAPAVTFKVIDEFIELKKKEFSDEKNNKT